MTELLKYIAATCVGGVFSITYSVKKILFESEPNLAYYLVIGFERLLLSILAGLIIFVGIKSKILFGDLIVSNFYASLFTGFIAGFSESFIPNLLNKEIKEK
jgi:hypothetical protein